MFHMEMKCVRRVIGLATVLHIHFSQMTFLNIVYNGHNTDLISANYSRYTCFLINGIVHKEMSM